MLAGSQNKLWVAAAIFDTSAQSLFSFADAELRVTLLAEHLSLSC
jgi:hypothetical protein